MASYYEIRDQLKTGDIILFSGKSAFSSLIKFFSRGKWSHMGMVYRMKDRSGQDTIYCWESAIIMSDHLKDAETGKRTNGVQTLVLSERIEQTLADGYELCVRHLNNGLDEEQLTTLDRFRHEVKGRRYEDRAIELLRAAWDGWQGKNREDLSSLFCSELVAEAYQRMNLLPAGRPSNEYTPTDFSEEGKPIKLIAPYSFGPEIKVEGF